MDSIKRLLKFECILWGALAVAAIAFPGATSLFKLPIAVSDSMIGGLYPVIGTAVSAFSTLFLIAYKKELRELKFARKLAVWGLTVGLICFSHSLPSAYLCSMCIPKRRFQDRRRVC